MKGWIRGGRTCQVFHSPCHICPLRLPFQVCSNRSILININLCEKCSPVPTRYISSAVSLASVALRPIPGLVNILMSTETILIPLQTSISGIPKSDCAAYCSWLNMLYLLSHHDVFSSNSFYTKMSQFHQRDSAWNMFLQSETMYCLMRGANLFLL